MKAPTLYLAAIALFPGMTAADAMEAETLVGALREGGHVIFIRHAATETDYADQVDAVMGDCSTQRTLSETGWTAAKRIGAAIASLGIPVGEVLGSEYCRAWQTADLVFGRYDKTPALNFEPAEDYTDAQFAAIRERMLPLMTAAPGTNRVLVGHDDPFEAATGIYPEPIGVANVVRPGSDGPEVLGRIEPGAWPSD
jgi:phosphohistidine phosphatase SixA